MPKIKPLKVNIHYSKNQAKKDLAYQYLARDFWHNENGKNKKIQGYQKV